LRKPGQEPPNSEWLLVGAFERFGLVVFRHRVELMQFIVREPGTATMIPKT
jgi:hypothetical protein